MERRTRANAIPAGEGESGPPGVQGIGAKRLAQGGGQGSGDRPIRLPGGPDQFGIPGPLDEPQGDHDGLRLLDGKHQRRQVEARARMYPIPRSPSTGTPIACRATISL